MSFIGGLNKGELVALLADTLAPYIKEVRQLSERLAAAESRLAGNGKELYTIKELTQLFGVSAATIHKWVKDGKLIKYKIGGRTEFKRTDVDKLIDLSKVTK